MDIAQKRNANRIRYVFGERELQYHLQDSRTPFVIVPSDKGNLLVIDDADGQRILGELATRRAAAYRAEYDFFPEGAPRAVPPPLQLAAPGRRAERRGAAGADGGGGGDGGGTA